MKWPDLQFKHTMTVIFMILRIRVPFFKITVNLPNKQCRKIKTNIVWH